MDPHSLDEDRYRWGRTAPIVQWNNPDDPTVKLGLTLKCGACKAPPGTPCTNTVNGQPLIQVRRWIHSYRLDKSMTTDKEPTDRPAKDRGLYENLTLRDRSRSRSQARNIGGIPE